MLLKFTLNIYYPVLITNTQSTPNYSSSQYTYLNNKLFLLKIIQLKTNRITIKKNLNQLKNKTKRI